MRHIDKQSHSKSAGISQRNGRLDQSNLPTDETILRGQNAWARVRDDHAREDWIHVGAALVIGRTEAMCDAHVNEPVGHNYNTVFRTK